MLARLGAGQIDALVELLQPATGEELHPLAIGREARVVAVFGHARRRTASAVDPIDTRFQTEAEIDQIATGLFAVDHPAAIGREARVEVEAGLQCQFQTGTAGAIQSDDLTERTIIEAHIDDGAAIGRVVRAVLETAVVSQALRRAIGQGHSVQRSGGMEEQLTAVR